MRSPRSYLIRALIDWIVDNDWTPHLLIAADVEGVVVPREHVKEDRIVLNISARAVRDFVCDDAAVSFDSRFSGLAFHVVLPLEAVLAVYARESGAGLAFDGTNVAGSFTSPQAGSEPSAGVREGEPLARQEPSAGVREGVPLARQDPTTRTHPGKKGRPTLTVIE